MQKTVHFSVDFQWLTDFIRDEWSAGQYTRAKQLLIEDCGLPPQVSYDVIRGKKKLAADPDDPDQGMVITDEWSPDLSKCLWWAGYPDPEDFKFFSLIEEFGVKGLTSYKHQIERLTRQMQETSYYFDKMNILSEAVDIPKKVLNFFNQESLVKEIQAFGRWKLLDYRDQNKNMDNRSINARDYLRDKRLNESNEDDSLKKLTGLSLDEHIEKLASFSEKPFPTYKTKIGWVSPDGKIYPCGHQEHARAMWEWFGMSEVGAENLGWIKITYSLFKPDDPLLLRGENNKPTQSQINILSKWAEFWELDFEDVMSQVGGLN